MLVGGALAAGLIGTLALPAGAQTTTTPGGSGNLTAFCAARMQIDSAHSKADTLAALEGVVTNAPSAILPTVTEIRDQFKKKGRKAFEIPEIAVADAFIYDNCPGTKVAVTAIDYEFQGLPATLPAGSTNFKLTNAAPKENHEMGIVPLTAAGESIDPEKLFAMPDKKAEKYADFSRATGMFAPAGETGYTIANLEPGTYVYACFLHVGGKKNGAPHSSKGMYGSFKVS